MSAASSTQRVLVIIPTFNERDNVTTITDRVLSAVENAHVLVVDDNSPDGTGEIADGLAEQNPRIHVLHRSKGARAARNLTSRHADRRQGSCRGGSGATDASRVCDIRQPRW